MKLLTYQAKNGEARLGFIHNGNVVDMQMFGKNTGLDLPSTMLEFIDLGIDYVPKVENVVQANGHAAEKLAMAYDELTILAPIPKPRKNIIGIGLNYTEHVAESARSLDTAKELPQKPVIFSKPPTAVIGTGEKVLLNRDLTNQLDWEVELAVIIDKKGKYVPKEKALDYVYGYTVINDISARDCRRSGQWIVSKGQDTFAPMGPILVTKDEIADPHNLQLRLTLNGVEKQNGNSRYMLFNINDLIEDLSTVFTIEPGDIIATGTPAGVGAGRTPQEWLKDGDLIEATVEGIGTLVNKVEEVKIAR